MNALESKLKNLLICQYGSLKKFTESVSMPWTTLNSVLNRGVNNSNITNVIKICEGLQIDCESLYYGQIISKLQKTTQPFVNEELEIIQKYRTLDQYGKDAVDRTVAGEYKRCQESETFGLYDQFSIEDQQKVREYMEGLLQYKNTVESFINSEPISNNKKDTTDKNVG